LAVKKDEEYFYDFIKKNDLGKKVFAHGKKIEKEKNEFLEKADVLIFPTEYKLEAHPRVILESMMFGLPVIANGIASIPSTIEQNKTGFVLKENTPEKIVKYIEKIYKNKELKIKMGEQGRKIFLEKFELNKYQKKFLDIFKRL
jgi:glycosyltransferase involved in cell wall biosynthesis